MSENGHHDRIRVLYVDDEKANLEAFKACFRRDFEIFLAIGAGEAKTILEKDGIHVIITDQRMPEVLGTELLEFAVRKYPLQSRILLTAYSDMEALAAAVNKGRIFRFLQKPWNEDELRNSIIEAHEVYKMRVEKEEIILELQKTNRRLEELLKEKLKRL
jgi:response regulator RpfG family c-di-GMP phosphodiesterase